MAALDWDAEGDYEVRCTIYLDGEPVGTCDALGSSIRDALYAATTDAECGQIAPWGGE